MSPTLQVQWGAYFKPDPTEQLAVVQMTQAALGGGAAGGEPLITKRIAVERLKPIFGIENVDAVLKDLEKEADERAQRELDAATAQIDAQARAQGLGQDAGGDAAGATGGGGRPASGKDNARKPPGSSKP
jgi:hypothetical protein